MRRPSWFALLACLFLCVLGWAVYRGWNYLAGPSNAEVPALSPGHQEVAWFSPATNGDGWERLVAALKSLEKDWTTVHPNLPPLRVSYQDAFLNETASVPQIALYFSGFEHARLWIRWYKLSGEIQQRQWLEKLRKRGRAPLAIIGGDSSDQALSTARDLKKMAMEGLGASMDSILAKKGLKKAAEELDKFLMDLRQEALALGTMKDALEKLDDLSGQLKQMGQGKKFEAIDWEQMEKAKTTDEFERTARELVNLTQEVDRLGQQMYKQSGWTSPLFFVSYATVDRFDDSGANDANNLTDSQWPKFIDVYKNRTFRFCFTNEHIAHAVLDFVQDNPQVWPGNRFNAATLAGLAAQGHSLNCLGSLAGSGCFRPVYLSALAWDDDRYSQDLANRMYKVFVDFFYSGEVDQALTHYSVHYVNYSVGGFYQPNPREQRTVGSYLGEKAKRAGQHQLLAVPTGVQPARRFLRTLCRRAPAEIQDLVVVTGDSINFNNVYRDGDLEWNVLDIPIPLIFFSHRNPVDGSAGFRQRNEARPSGTSDDDSGFHTTGSHDLLLMRDIIEALVQAAWDQTAWSADPEVVCERLRKSHWQAGRVQGAAGSGPLLFDEEGNRTLNTGEHVVWLQPIIADGRNLPRALLSVWRIDKEIADTRTWQRVGEPIVVHYNQAAEIGLAAEGN